jgi:hypothetical protein
VLEGLPLRKMAIELSAELMRLLSILSDRPHGATRYELALLEGINARLIYNAVELDLVEVERESNRKTGGCRFRLSDRGRKLLNIID